MCSISPAGSEPEGAWERELVGAVRWFPALDRLRVRLSAGVHEASGPLRAPLMQLRFRKSFAMKRLLLR
jgi:hypothetical protein